MENMSVSDLENVVAIIRGMQKIEGGECYISSGHIWIRNGNDDEVGSIVIDLDGEAWSFVPAQ